MRSSDRELEAMRAAWEAVARYRVVVKQPGRADELLATGLPLHEARDLEERTNHAIESAPDFRPVMSRALALIELENKTEALEALRRRREGRSI